MNFPASSHPLRVAITGGATNIGLAITEAFLREGAAVAIGQPDPVIAAPLVQRYGTRVTALSLDAGESAQCHAFITAAVQALGGLDVLVNNAAITGSPAIAALSAMTPEFFDRVMRVNLGGPIFCAQAAAPHLRASGRGVIVNISSINAVRPQRGALAYAASKAALQSVTQSLAKELAPDGIRVVAVAPGDIRVDTSPELLKSAAAGGAGSDVINQTPLGQGEPADIAATVVFLSSARAKFVTGATWLVDGGLLA